ncbi:MAG: NADH-quinone oxidoreductase subunit C [Chloroflexota bacterium]
MADSEGAASGGEEGPVEGLPALPEILAEARRRLESIDPELEFKPFDDRLEVTLPPERLVEACLAVKNDLGYRMLMSVTALDWRDRFELIYHAYRLDSAFPIVARCFLPREEAPEVPSLTPFWPGAEFQEREIYDLMGIVFVGHPDLRRILLADDFQGYPLRKDFEQDPTYVLVPHLRLPGYAGAQRGETSTGRFLDE